MERKEGVGEERGGDSISQIKGILGYPQREKSRRLHTRSTSPSLCPRSHSACRAEGHMTGDLGSDSEIMAVSWIIHLERLAELAWWKGSREHKQRELRNGTSYGPDPSFLWPWLLKGTNPIF